MEKVTKVRKILAIIGIAVGTAATVLGVIGLKREISGEGGIQIVLAVFFALISYLLAGGIGKALKASAAVMKWGWLLIPVFPLDIFTGLIGFIAGVLLFAVIPGPFVIKNGLEVIRS